MQLHSPEGQKYPGAVDPFFLVTLPWCVCREIVTPPAEPSRYRSQPTGSQRQGQRLSINLWQVREKLLCLISDEAVTTLLNNDIRLPHNGSADLGIGQLVRASDCCVTSNPLTIGEHMKRLVAFFIIFWAVDLFGDSIAQTSGPSVVRLPEDIVYKGLLGTPQHVTLFGDPTNAGLYVDRIKFTAGKKVMPHWHPDPVRTVLVLSGTFYLAVGEVFDETNLTPYPAGTFYSEPPGTPHYACAKDGEVILQVTAVGPTGNTRVPPK